MEGFEQREGVYGGRPAVLTIPRKDKFTWTPEERHLRSVVHDARTGEVLSRGFPKFHNFGEVPEEDAETERAFTEGRVVLREKLDGSLIIRDVVDGRVCWRTRGSLGLGEFEERVMALVNAGEPWWADPRAYAPDSLLFEYTSPENRIVVRYPSAALTALGRVTPDFRAARAAGYWMGLELWDDPCRFAAADIAHARHIVNTLGEGVVVACYNGDGHKLVKMKSAEYMRLHSLMTECTRAKVFDLLERECGGKAVSIRGALEAAGFDWEMMQDARQWAEEYAARDMAVTKLCNHIRRILTGLGNADRKTVALTLKDIEAAQGWMPGAFALAMVMHTGGAWQDNAAAMRCDMPVNAYRASRKQ